MLFFEYPNYYATKVTFTKHSRQKIRKKTNKKLEISPALWKQQVP
jgi:hypothetical protein